MWCGVHEERSDKALDIFRELHYTGRETDQFTIPSVMNVCSDLSVPIHCYVKEKKRTRILDPNSLWQFAD
jgi:hypothetical protein